MMNKKLSIAGLGALAAVFFLGAGCVERRVVYVPQPTGGPPPAETVVAEAPPPPQTEVIVTAPGPEYVWVPGYWAWNGRWVWIGGRWGSRPHPHAVWVGPRYVRRAHGYVYVHGYWR